MREFTKNLFSFSWALSLFGAKQLGSLLDPQQVAKGAPGAASDLDSVTGAVADQLGKNLRQAFDVGDRLQGQVVDAMFGLIGMGPPPRATAGAASPAAAGPSPAAPGPSPAAPRPAICNANSPAGEEVLITYTRGTGTCSPDKQFVALHNQIYELDGTENGLHESVWQPLFKNPSELLARPAPPVGTMDAPAGPVPSWPVSYNTIARWSYRDGSSISSVGPAASHLVPLSDGSFLYLMITAQIITEGTGRYAGARGLTQSLGAIYLPAGVNMFSPQGPATFDDTTLDTFKVFTAGAGGAGRSGRTS